MKIKEPEYGDITKKIIIISGAGLSAESGIKTFRETDGLWENHNVSDICNESTWKRNFELVHNFYNDRRVELNDVSPNLAHLTISNIKKTYGDDCFVFTQNVDDLLERAGTEEVFHLHGTLKEMFCYGCGKSFKIGYERYDYKNDSCPNCSSRKGVKPNIVFFGGQAPLYKQMHKALGYLKNSESVLIIIGTMGNVISFRDLIGREIIYPDKVIIKKNISATVILNNLEANEYFPDGLTDIEYYENATSALPKIEKWLQDNF